jgi:hypothetical protein
MSGADREVPELGSIEPVNPREIWANEALNFTPWLRDHPDVLAKALGVDIELTDSEVSVGLFSVDLVGTDVSNGRRLIVENQLEATDHSHLGQVLTYAGGLNAATIVWISPAFRDEHRQALDWLNEHTDDSIAFFGLQLEVIKIGDSKPAANLRPVAMPNEWGHQIKQATESQPSEQNVLRQRFFDSALTELKRQSPNFTNTSHAMPQSWLSMAAGRTGFQFTWSFSKGQLRTELYIDAGDQPTNKAYFDALNERAAELEGEVGYQLVWERLDSRRASRVYTGRTFAPAELADESHELRDWAVQSMLAFARVFRPVIRRLAAPALSAASEASEAPEAL